MTHDDPLVTALAGDLAAFVAGRLRYRPTVWEVPDQAGAWRRARPAERFAIADEWMRKKLADETLSNAEMHRLGLRWPSGRQRFWLNAIRALVQVNVQ